MLLWNQVTLVRFTVLHRWRAAGNRHVLIPIANVNVVVSTVSYRRLIAYTVHVGQRHRTDSWPVMVSNHRSPESETNHFIVSYMPSLCYRRTFIFTIMIMASKLRMYDSWLTSPAHRLFTFHHTMLWYSRARLCYMVKSSIHPSVRL